MTDKEFNKEIDQIVKDVDDAMEEFRSLLWMKEESFMLEWN